MNGAHGSWHARYGLSPGRLVALFFVLRSLSWTTGCGSGPADGEIGGKCKDGCRWHCDDGAVCDDSRDVCVAAAESDPPAGTFVPPPPPAQTTCDFAASDDCDGGLAFDCTLLQEIPVQGVECTDVGSAGDDTRRFCCVASAEDGGGSLFH